MKKALLGPFTFILSVVNNLPLDFTAKKTVRIRIPDNLIPREILKQLGHPIASISIYDDDEVIEYITDPKLIIEKYDKLIDIVIDGGYGDNEDFTVVDLSQNDPVILREGKGQSGNFL